MSLQWKVNLILIFAFSMLAVAIFAVQRVIVAPSFAQLEIEEAREDMERGVDGLQREIDHLSILCGDWAAWDEMYAFVVDKNQSFVDANLVNESFQNNSLTLVAILDADLRPVWHGGPDDGDGIDPMLDITRLIQQTPSIKPAMEPETKVSGVLDTPRGEMIFCARPIFTSQNEGPARGVLVMGRLFNNSAVAALAERTRIDLHSWPAVDAAKDPILAAIMARCTSQNPMHLERTDGNVLQVYTTYPGIDGKPALLWRANVPAEISQRGFAATNYAVVTAVALGAVVVAGISIAVHTLIVVPVIRLKRHAQAVGTGDQRHVPLNVNRTDEIGRLAMEFDRMMARLSESQERLLDAAHRSGLADNASEVLHNIGNALNSVNVSKEVLAETLRTSKLGGLTKAADLLREHRSTLPEFLGNDPRGGKLVDYVIQLSELLTDEQNRMLRETDGLAEKVSHIRDVVAMQQTQAFAPQFMREINVTALLDESIAMHAIDLERHGIKLCQEYAEVPTMQLQKPRLMQVLMNLITNAIDAMVERGATGNRLIVRSKRSDEAGGVIIKITDTGHGFAASDRKKLFAHGFTTKKDGHGIGLHFCANAVGAMNGLITAESPGPGQGATFRIELFPKEVKASL